MPWSNTSRQSRGYGKEWAAKRQRVLERDKFLCQCQHCKRDGRTTLATEVDHIISRAKAVALGWAPERIETLGNLQAINSECHKRKTQEERGKEFKAKVKIGLDGFPVGKEIRGD